MWVKLDYNDHIVLKNLLSEVDEITPEEQAVAEKIDKIIELMTKRHQDVQAGKYVPRRFRSHHSL